MKRWLAHAALAVALIANGANAAPETTTAAPAPAPAPAAGAPGVVRPARPVTAVPGAQYRGNGRTSFRVWAPNAAKGVDLVLVGPNAQRTVTALTPTRGGVYVGTVRATPGTRYSYRLDGGDELPDPASSWQPEGPNKPSAIANLQGFRWTDQGWRGADRLDVNKGFIEQVHVGTFTWKGDLDTAVHRLKELRGASAVQLLPLAVSSGNGWGYDGVNPNAVLPEYGSPTDVQRFVNAAHRQELPVIMDVVYNHFGPEGNHAPKFGPYLDQSSKHPGPWGPPINIDHPQVQKYFLANVQTWVRDYHVDGLRIDASHFIFNEDFKRAIVDTARAAGGGRKVFVNFEAGDHVSRAVGPEGADGVWADDLNHTIAVGMAGQARRSYFAPYDGSIEELAFVAQNGRRYDSGKDLMAAAKRGEPVPAIDPTKLITNVRSNHDQIGNRKDGDRLITSVSPAAYRAIRTLHMFLPQTPLLFQGERWGSDDPFQYFTSHKDPALGKAVTQGRTHEFRELYGASAQVPNPQAHATFERSKLRWYKREEPQARGIEDLTRSMGAMRAQFAGHDVKVDVVGPETLAVTRLAADGRRVRLVFNRKGEFSQALPADGGAWRVRLSSEDEAFGGTTANARVEGGKIRIDGPGALVLEEATAPAAPAALARKAH